MSFLIYEHDPLVRQDIHETILDMFDTAVCMISDLIDLPDIIARKGQDAVAILSVENAESDTVLDVLSRMVGKKVVLIGTSPPEGAAIAADFVYVPRPFNTATLSNALKSVLSGRQ